MALPPSISTSRAHLDNRCAAGSPTSMVCPGRSSLADHPSSLATSFRRDRHRDAGDLHVHRAEVVAAGDVERPPVVAAEREVGGGGGPVHDAGELLARGGPEPAGPRA